MWVLIWDPPEAEPSPHQALLGSVPLTHKRVREARARFLSVLGDRTQGLSNAEGKRGQPGCDSLVPRQRAACFFTTSVPFLGCRPTHRPAARARCSSRIWPCAVNFREGNLSKVMMVLFSAISCGDNKARQLQGQLPGGGG